MTRRTLDTDPVDGLQRAAPRGPADHPLRTGLANEVHARPYESLSAPVRASHLALFTGEHPAEEDLCRLAELCALYHAAAPPVPGADHYSVDLGAFRLKWERHTEFCTYTFFQVGAFSEPFELPVISLVPSEWLAKLDGRVLVAIHVALEPREHPRRELGELARLFASNTVVGSEVAGGAAIAWTDLQIHADRFSRILVHDVSLRARQAGRLVQRLLEIETYRMMALLALPLARRYGPEISRADRQLTDLTGRLAHLEGLEDERGLLGELSLLAAEVERISAATSYRFAAARAYYDLVQRRIGELREQRIEGLQTFAEFMDRRMAPAMRTCESVRERLEALAARVARASNLLRTRVDVALEAQNRDLLASMDRRAQLQLRLQETVEGLSVVVLSYYLVGLVSYGLKALRAAGAPIDTDLALGLAIPLVVVAVFLGVRHFRRKLTRGASGPPADRH
jgi:uncharacterized membrane-anchored protein